jgi:hypothetical protein
MKSRLFVQFLPLALAAFAVCGCNETSQPAVQQAAMVPCRCSAPIATAPASETSAPTRHYRRHSAHRWASWHESQWNETWSESERTSATVEYGYRGASEQGGSSEVEAPSARYTYWVDAYGRKHCYDRVRGQEIAWQHAAGDDAARRDPWHGYDGNDGPENGY